jgi:hypothetical protein
MSEKRRALSEVRSGGSVKGSKGFCARSINPFGGSRLGHEAEAELDPRALERSRADFSRIS